LTEGRIAAAHGRFSGIRQVAPVCTLPDTCFLGPNQIHNPNSISTVSAIFAQLLAEHPYTLQWAVVSPFKIGPFPWGISISI